MKDKKSFLAKIAIFTIVVSLWGDAILIPCLNAIYTELPTNSTFLETYIVTGPSLVAIPIILICGKFCQFISKKTLLIASIVVYIIGGVWGSFAQSMEVMAVTRTLSGVSVAVGMTLAFSIIAETFQDEKEREKIIGYYQFGYTFYGAVITFVAGILAVASWRSAFLLNALSVIELVLVIFFLPKMPPEGKNGEGSAAKEKLPVKKVALIMLSCLLFLSFAFVYYYYIDIYVTEKELGTSALSGTISSIYTIGAAVISIAFGFLYSHIKKITESVFFITAGLVFLTLSLPLSVPLVCVVLFVGGLAVGLALCYYPVKIAAEVPASQTTFVNSLYMAVSNVAAYAMSYVPILLKSIFGKELLVEIYPYAGIVMCVLGILFLIPAITSGKKKA